LTTYGRSPDRSGIARAVATWADSFRASVVVICGGASDGVGFLELAWGLLSNEGQISVTLGGSHCIELRIPFFLFLSDKDADELFAEGASGEGTGLQGLD
jgi:hypothetical protein